MSKEVLNSYFRKVKKGENGRDIYLLGSQLMLGQVEKIHFVDDSTNISKEFVEYDVSVRDARGGQSTFTNVRRSNALAGTNDFEETVLENNAFAFSGNLDTSNFFKNKNGTIVILGFLNDSLDKPCILGALSHPKNVGATRADGIIKRGEFRGLSWKINSLGELTITYNGNRNSNGELARSSTGPTQLKIDQNGDFFITNNNEQAVQISRSQNKTNINLGNNSVVIDGSDNSITILNASGKQFKLTNFQILGEGTEPLVLGDTLESILGDFLDSLSGITPGSPGMNAEALGEIASAASTLNGVLATMKSSNSKTD